MGKNLNYSISASLILISSLYINISEANATLKNKFYRNLSNIFGRNNFGNGSYDIRENVKVSKKLTKEVNSLVKNNKVTGINSYNFNISNINDIEPNYFYYQILNDNEPITLISPVKPKIIAVKNETVTVKYINEKGREQIFISDGVPNWMLGLDITTDYNKKQKETMNPMGETSKLLPNLIESNTSSDKTIDFTHLKPSSIKKTNESTKVPKRHSTNDDLSHLGAAAGIDNYGYEELDSLTNIKE